MDAKQGRLRLIASADGRNGSVSLRQDASIFASIMKGDDEIDYPLSMGRMAYVHVVRGCINVNGVQLSAGDAAHIQKEAAVRLSRAEAAEVLFFDLPN